MTFTIEKILDWLFSIFDAFQSVSEFFDNTMITSVQNVLYEYDPDVGLVPAFSFSQQLFDLVERLLTSFNLNDVTVLEFMFGIGISLVSIFTLVFWFRKIFL